MDSFEHKTFTVSRNFTYSYYKSPSDSTVDHNKPAILLLHGWPDDAFLWEKIVPYLQHLDYPLLIPDCLGYAGTSKPLEPASYNSRDMAKDMMELLDHEGVKQIISTGHDWGSFLAQRIWLWNPERVVGIMLLNVAYMPPIEKNPFDLDARNKMLEQFTGQPRLAYFELFTAPDGPRIQKEHFESMWTVLHGNPENWMAKMFCVYGAMREFLLKDETVPLKKYAQDPVLKHRYKQRVSRDGFEAPNMWYHAMTFNHHFNVEKELPKERLKVTVPMLFLGCSGDAVALTQYMEAPKQAGLLPDVAVKEFESGHWCTLEIPDQIGPAMVEWLKEKGI